MDEKLNWNEFEPVGRSNWREAADKALKGKEFSNWLEWESRDKLKLESYKDRADIVQDGAVPGSAPWSRGSKREGNDWIICDAFSSPKNLDNQSILTSLKEGVNGLLLEFNEKESKHLRTLLNEVMFEILDVQLYTSDASVDRVRELIDLASQRGIQVKGLKAAVLRDVMNSEEGLLEDEDINDVMVASRLSAEAETLIRTILVDQRSTQNKGAGPALDMAFALAKGHEYLLRLLEDGFSADQAGALFQFNFAIGPEYLNEIARLRAFRPLWHQLISKYQPAHSCSSGIHIHTENALWTSAVNDAPNNLLRNTSVAMSASLGGCDSLFLHPFDVKLEEKGSQAPRISRNIQFVLRDEAYFNKVADPAGGSYFIEDLTEKMADRAWELFQAIEASGGYLKAARKGLITSMINEDANELFEAYRLGERSWIGVNKYPPKELQSMTENDSASSIGNLEFELLKLKGEKA